MFTPHSMSVARRSPVHATFRASMQMVKFLMHAETVQKARSSVRQQNTWQAMKLVLIYKKHIYADMNI